MVIFKALACDSNGTLASEDRLGPDALATLAKAREAGLRLILVTGRTFFELTRVCECLDLFDGVVAENGGVLYVPATAMIRALAPPPPPRFLAELDRRGVGYQLGRVVVGTARSEEAAVRAALAEAGVQLEFVPNRAALMVLPAGISKGAGVRQMLPALGLSFHERARPRRRGERPRSLRRLRLGGCPAGRARADARAPTGLSRARTARPSPGASSVPPAFLPLDRSARQRIALGWTAVTAAPVSLLARGINVLIHGDPLSGKSWLAGALVERLHERRYALCVIDPEGEYGGLARLARSDPGRSPGRGRRRRGVPPLQRDPAACVVIDLSTLGHGEKVRLIERSFRAVREMRRRFGVPHWVVLDEVHYSLHQEGVAERALATEDRGFCLVTYKPSWVRPSVMRAVDVVILARTTASHELAFLRSLLAEGGGAGGGRVLSALAALPRGELLVIQKDGTGAWAPLTFTATPRATAHVRHLKKYADFPVRAEHAFQFREPGGRWVARADSLNGFRRSVAAADGAVLASHAGRNDFSRWVRDVFADPELAAQLRKAERRWSRGEIPDLRRVIDDLIAARYWSEES